MKMTPLVTNNLLDREHFSQEAFDRSSLKNFPNLFAHGLTMVMGAPFTGEKGGKEFLKKALMITRTIEDSLNNVRGHQRGYAECYQEYHMHATVGAIVRSDYEHLNRPLSSIGPAVMPEMLEILQEAQNFTIKLQNFLINSRGEIILLGRAFDDTSGKILSDFREKLKTKAEFALQKYNLGDRIHITLGYIKGMPPLENLEKLGENVEKLLSCWMQEDYFATIEISRVKVVHYRHRSLRTIAAQVEFELGEQSQYTSQKIEEILIGKTQNNLQKNLEKWKEDKIQLWQQWHQGEDLGHRREELTKIAEEYQTE